MLQPAQLQEVSVRYRREIAELQTFFLQTDIAVGTPDALPAVASRLLADRSFHRDLRSHIWVLLDGNPHGNALRSADLLGIVAVAAGGERFAAIAEEGDAHILLRFLMESRRALAEPLSDAAIGNTAGVSSSPKVISSPQSLTAPDTAAEAIQPAATLPTHASENAAGSAGQRSALMAALATAAPPASASEGATASPLSPAETATPGAPAVLQADDLRRYPASSVERARRLMESGALDGAVAPAEPLTTPTPPAESAAIHLIALHNVDEVASYDDNILPADAVLSPLTSGIAPASAPPVTHAGEQIEAVMAEPALLTAVPPSQVAPTPATPFSTASNPSASLTDLFFPEHPADEEVTERRRRVPAWVVYTVSGLWLLALLWFGYDRFHANAPLRPQPAPIVNDTAPSTPASSGPTTNSPRPSPSTPAQPRSSQRSAADGSVTHSSISAGATASRQPLPATDTAAPIIRVNPPAPAAPGSTPADNGSLASTRVQPTGNAGLLNAAPRSQQPTAIPSAVLSRQLGSPTVPAYAADPAYASADGRPHPRLLRRKPALGVAAGSDELVELRAPNLSNVSRSATPVRSGTVTPTCLGMMAGNLMYSPAPAYPAAAAAARVEGAVRIQATVDRDGTITAARVVSGPPLLRDAALDAVQRWRYKPYLAGGKPATAATLAVLDFQLQ